MKKQCFGQMTIFVIKNYPIDIFMKHAYLLNQFSSFCTRKIEKKYLMLQSMVKDLPSFFIGKIMPC